MPTSAIAVTVVRQNANNGLITFQVGLLVKWNSEGYWVKAGCRIYQIPIPCPFTVAILKGDHNLRSPPSLKHLEPDYDPPMLKDFLERRAIADQILFMQD